MTHRLSFFLVFVGGLLALSSGHAHPVPKQTHDRTVVVTIRPDAIVVEYRLELDEWTAVNDLVAVLPKDRIADLAKPADVYAAFTRAYARVLADNLHATLDGVELDFRPVKDGHEVWEDHLRCTFVFRADMKAIPDKHHRLDFRDGNYDLDGGRINTSLHVDVSIERHPDEEKPSADRRQLSATWDWKPCRGAFQLVQVESATAPSPSAPAARPRTLLELLLGSHLGFGVLLLMSAGFGAVHALTPGHGKTLVAAYLVGERGTVGHAFVLGLVTALTHTGSVLLVAILLALFVDDSAAARVQTVLGFGGGLLIAGLGFWLLLRRLSGGADHIHIGGGHHHHHDEAPATGAVTFWGLVVLGIGGGIVPCWDAIAMLVFAVAAQRMWLAVPLLLAFSVGLSAVLVLIGIVVVYARGWVGGHWAGSRVVRALPIVSALVITILGLWLCYDSIHPAEPPALVQSTAP